MNFTRADIPSIFSSIYGGMRRFDIDMAKVIQDINGSLSQMFAKGIGITDNLDCQIVSYTSNAVANTEDTVAHTLKRVPSGFIVVDIDKAGVVYRSGTTFTVSNIYLKCSTTSTALKVLVY